jgi:HPt (histidine-containing phosphotransfer) domain-containing protein
MAVTVFDLAQIGEQWGDPTDETYRMILGIFMEECAGLCARARPMLAEGRRDQVLHIGHGLRGAAANVGAVQLAGRAQALEAAALTGTGEALAALVAEMEQAWAAVEAEVAAGGPVSHGD